MNQELEQIVVEVNKVVKGKEKVVRKALAAILAGGHVLLEDIPGVGKTTLAMALGRAMELVYKRMQFTPDVLPSDIVGFTMYNSATGEFEYKKGAVFCNLFLADELNRTSSKTQSALLEVMEEAKVTVDGVSYPLPVPFTVIATENPFGSSGTQLLPESQLDRFMICLSMGYPSHDAAIDILKGSVGQGLEQVGSVITSGRLLELRSQVENLYVDDSIHEYIINLTEETRREPLVGLGVSPRGSIALLKMAKAMAVMRGGDYVVPEDVLGVIDDVWKHRIKLNALRESRGHGCVGYDFEDYGKDTCSLMDKRLRLNGKGVIGFLAVFAVLVWMWSFFRSYLLFLVMLLMITYVIISAVSLWLVRDGIRTEIVLPYHRVGKNTDVPVDIRVLHPLRVFGFAIDLTYRFGNLFTGSMEEKKKNCGRLPGKGHHSGFWQTAVMRGGLRYGWKNVRCTISCRCFI